MNELVQELNRLCDEQPFHTGWYLKDLHSGEEANRARRPYRTIREHPEGVDLDGRA